jgi:hypothetical protein
MVVSEADLVKREGPLSPWWWKASEGGPAPTVDRRTMSLPAIESEPAPGCVGERASIHIPCSSARCQDVNV